MGKRPFIFIIVFSLWWLAACGRDEPKDTPVPMVFVTETAVSTYLDIIQQAPSSPWSWLAWARLEPAGS